MENTQTNRPTYKEIFGDILKKAGFEGTAEDGFTKEQDIVTGTMVINGRPVQQKEHSKTTVKLLGEGEIGSEKKTTKIIGINITVEKTDFGDFWTNEDDFEMDLKKILGVK